MNTNRLDNLKKNTSIVELAQRLGLNPKGFGNQTHATCCPFHEDKTPSMVLMPGANRFECKGCDAKGTVIDLVMGVNKCDFKEAVNFLEPGFFNFSDRSEKVELKVPPVIPETYLQSRGITQETADKFGLKVVGAKIVIPLPTGEKYRHLSGEQKYSHKPGTKDCLFKTKEADKGVILAEGEFDAIITFQETDYPTWTTTCGVTSFKEEWVKDFLDVEKIYIAFDNDEAGVKGSKKVADLLGIDRCFRVNIPKEVGKDLTNYFVSGKSKADFQVLLKSAKPMKVTLKDKFQTENQDKGQKIYSGFTRFDKAIGGFRPGCAYAIAGLEKSGKTSFLLNILGHMLFTDQRVGYINTELPFADFCNRNTALYNNRPITYIEQNSDLVDEWLDLVDGRLFYADKADKDLLDDNELISFEKTKFKMDEWLAKGVSVIMLDNLTTYASQLKEGKKGWEILASSMAQATDYAFKNKVTILMVIHTTDQVVFNETPAGIRHLIQSNEPEKIFTESATITRKPTLADVYGGGVASSQLSGAFLIWRPFQKFDNPTLQSMSSLVIDSSRFGGEGQEIRMDFIGTHARFMEVANEELK